MECLYKDIFVAREETMGMMENIVLVGYLRDGYKRERDNFGKENLSYLISCNNVRV